MKLSNSEHLLVYNVCKELKGKDGEVDTETMYRIWEKIRNTIMRKMKEGHLQIDLFDVILWWLDNPKKDYKELSMEVIGDLKLFLDTLQNNQSDYPLRNWKGNKSRRKGNRK